MDLTGYLRRIMNQDVNETFDPATDSLEAIRDFIAVMLGVGPSVGLWMFGVCDPAMVASTVTIVTNNLTGLPDDIFNDQFYMQVIRNANWPGAAPEGEIRQITNFVGATQTFTVNAFSANVEAGDLICIIHESLITPGLEVLSTIVNAIFDLVNAGLVTTETGGTLTTTGALQDLYINNAPAGVFEPLTVQINLAPMLAADTIVITENYRIRPGGGFVQKDTETFAGVQAVPLKNIDLEPNRYGIQVTIQRTGGADHPYHWEVFYRG